MKSLSKKTEVKKSNSISSEYAKQSVEITPLIDFPSGIHHNEIHIDNIKEGVPVTIPRMFLPNMVTEGVIKKSPKEG